MRWFEEANFDGGWAGEAGGGNALVEIQTKVDIRRPPLRPLGGRPRAKMCVRERETDPLGAIDTGRATPSLSLFPFFFPSCLRSTNKALFFLLHLSLCVLWP